MAGVFFMKILSFLYTDFISRGYSGLIINSCIHMSLDTKDIELIERIVYKCGDDIAVSISRSFERLEERIDAAESRLYTRMADLEDRIEGSRQDVADEIGELKAEIREISRVKDGAMPLLESTLGEF